MIIQESYGKSKLPDRCQCVVILEDDAAIRETLLAALASEGYAAMAFGDPLSAVEYLRNHRHPALVLSDVTMPQMSGTEFLRMRRDKDIWMNVPVIMMSSAERPTGVSDIEAFVKKPMDLDLLFELVGRYCDKGGHPDAKLPDAA